MQPGQRFGIFNHARIRQQTTLVAIDSGRRRRPLGPDPAAQGLSRHGPRPRGRAGRGTGRVALLGGPGQRRGRAWVATTGKRTRTAGRAAADPGPAPAPDPGLFQPGAGALGRPSRRALVPVPVHIHGGTGPGAPGPGQRRPLHLGLRHVESRAASEWDRVPGLHRRSPRRGPDRPALHLFLGGTNRPQADRPGHGPHPLGRCLFLGRQPAALVEPCRDSRPDRPLPLGRDPRGRGPAGIPQQPMDWAFDALPGDRRRGPGRTNNLLSKRPARSDRAGHPGRRGNGPSAAPGPSGARNSALYRRHRHGNDARGPEASDHRDGDLRRDRSPLPIPDPRPWRNTGAGREPR